MSRSYVPPPDTVIGIQILGSLFEHQVRVAQMCGAAMLSTHAALSRSAAPTLTGLTRRAVAPRLPERRRTYATPV